MKTMDDEIQEFATVGGFCRTKQLATLLGMTCEQIRRLCNEDRLKFKRIPGYREYLIQRSSILGLFNGEATTTEGTGRSSEEEEREMVSVLPLEGRTRAGAQRRQG